MDRQKRDGTYPLIFRLHYNRKKVKIPTGYCFKVEDWDEARQRVKPQSKVINNVTRFNNQLNQQMAKIMDTVTDLEQSEVIYSLTLKDLKAKIQVALGKANQEDFFSFTEQLIEEKRAIGKNGTAKTYQDLSQKLRKLVRNKNLSFEEISFDFLKKIERDHFSVGNGVGGLGVYMRTLKVIYNRAIKSGLVSASHYPFHGYKIKRSEPDRRALSVEEFDLFRAQEYPVGSGVRKAHNLFMASFYLRGMNWMDLALLTQHNIQGDWERIVYVRHKTGKRFSIKVSPALKEILEEYHEQGSTKESFLFPILKLAWEKDRHHPAIINKRKKINKYLKSIAESLDIKPFTIYAARHTYATTAKRKGVPTPAIQESLGHETEEITQTYLDSFENEVIDQYDELIMSS